MVGSAKHQPNMSTSRNHPASLVDRSEHHPALVELMDAKVSRNVIAYVVDRVVEAVDYAFSRPTASSSSKERGRSARRHEANFANFVTRVVSNADVKMPVIATALVYIERARRHLQIALEEWACERVFLGAIIVASKYLNDSTLKNVHWAYCTNVFGKSDVGRIEREFLDVLAFELSITEDDLATYYDELARAARISERRRRIEQDVASQQEERPIPVRRTTTNTSTSSSRSSGSAGSVPELSPPSSTTTSSAGSPITPAASSAPTNPPGLSPRSKAKARAATLDAPRSTAVHVAGDDAMDVDHAPVAPKAVKPAPKAKRHSAVDLLRSIPGLQYHRSTASRSPTHRAAAATTQVRA